MKTSFPKFGPFCFVLLALMVVGGTLPSAAQAQAATHVWARWQATLHSTRPYKNPYRDVVLRVTYTGPAGQVEHGYGFWDGGNIFRLRHAFPTPGHWRWKSACSDPRNTGLQAQHGTVQVKPYHGSNPLYRHGFLRVSANHRYLCYADGTPFLWMGDTAWVGPMKSTPKDWETYLADRVRKHFTVIQIAPAPWWAGKHDAAGNPPFFGPDLARWNPAFWQAYEKKVERANEKGLFVLMVGIMEPTTRYPTVPAARLFARQLVARLDGNFIAFSPSFDSGYRPLGDAVGEAIRETSSAHLITQHPGTTTGKPVNTIAETYFDRSYLSFAGDQTGHNGGNWELCARQAIVWNRHLYHRTPTKPVINLEAMYDVGGKRAFNAKGARSLGWRSWLSGAMGYTYGTDLYEWETNPKKPGYWRRAMSLPSSKQMTLLHNFLARHRWWRLIPTPSWVKNQPAPYLRRAVFARTPRGHFALAYLPDDHAAEIQLAHFPGAVSAHWFDPTSGRSVAIAGAPWPNRGFHRFQPPGKNTAGDADWVLVLQARP